MPPKNTASLLQQDGSIYLQGTLDFNNAMQVLQDGSDAINKFELSNLSSKSNQIIFDFSQLTEANSVLMALILQWQRLAFSKGMTIKLVKLSKNLANLFALCGLREVLSLPDN